MKTFALIATAALASTCLAGAARAQTTTYITDFTKNNNIYTNLNEAFPNTGPGVPGSGVGTPNASFLFNPTTFNSSNTNDVNNVGDNGINFELTSNATGQDFTQVGSGAGVNSLVLPINIANTTNVYLLAAAYDGVSANVTFTGSGGATETFNGVALPDFNGGGSVNSVSGGLADQTVYRVTDVGAGGSGNSTTGAYNSYDLTELGFTLGSQFNGQTLTSATVTSNGYETLILGATAVSLGSVSAAPEPSTWLTMILGIGGVGMMLRHGKRRTGSSLGRRVRLEV